MNALEAIFQLGGVDENQLNPMPSSGSYALFINVSRKINLRPEKQWTLDPGNYVYAGRASRGLPARVARHKKRNKLIRWHIDWLTTQRSVTCKNIIILPEHPEQECAIVRALMNLPTPSAPIARFGSSDCREGCPAHLIMIPNT